MTLSTKRLNDVILIRPFLILLLVIYHSFIIYNGGWAEPANYKPNEFYKWISKFSISFMLEMFVFISGYLFAFQQIKLKKISTLKKTVKKKFNRLIIPSIFFSIIYYLLFNNKPFNLFSFLYDIFKGIGHLWFLPMLFWCFIGGYLLTKLKINNKLKLLFCFSLAIISFIPIPFQINNSMYYLFYFFMGYIFYANREKILARFVNIKFILFGIILFSVLFITLSFFKDQLLKIEITNIFYKVIKHSLLNLSRIFCASVGVFITYITANYILIRKSINIPQWIMFANTICFGVYIYHQFILQFIYYNTSFPIIVGSYWLPILSCIITLISSVILTKFTLKTKLGRFLIG